MKPSTYWFVSALDSVDGLLLVVFQQILHTLKKNWSTLTHSPKNLKQGRQMQWTEAMKQINEHKWFRCWYFFLGSGRPITATPTSPTLGWPAWSRTSMTSLWGPGKVHSNSVLNGMQDQGHFLELGEGVRADHLGGVGCGAVGGRFQNRFFFGKSPDTAWLFGEFPCFWDLLIVFFKFF